MDPKFNPDNVSREIPELEPVDPLMFGMFKDFIKNTVGKENLEKSTSYFTGVDMDYDQLTNDDARMFFCYKQYPGYSLPTIAEFNTYRDKARSANNPTRTAYLSYISNVITAVLIADDIEKKKKLE